MHILSKKTTPKAFGGSVGSGSPFEDFEEYLDRPDEVKDNLDHLRPMIQAVKQMAEMPGWKTYIRPFLEKQADARKLIPLIREGKSATYDAAKIEAFGGFLNYVNSLVRTADSLAAMDVKKKDEATGE
jgi:hypothetical protein